MGMKILNLYAGIGGNRELWGDEHKITAVEIDPKIAEEYKQKFPNDDVIITDAHQYLIEHYEKFDFIWSSPPCPTHSRMRNLKNNCKECIKKYPDMKLYEEILYLKHFFKGKWVVENVISWYNPLIPPVTSGNHYFWGNIHIPIFTNKSRHIRKGKTKDNNKVEALLGAAILREVE
jgi:DNA (cytosine-5)-methyltransferase 1